MQWNDVVTDGTDPDERTCPVSRRAFMAAAGAGVGGLATQGAAAARERTQADRFKMSDELEWLYDNVGSGERIPTMIKVFDERAFDLFGDVGTEVHVTSEPWPAMYAELTPGELDEVSQSFLVTRLEYSPGANPFWRHFDYPDRVFPDTEEALDYIAFEEAIAGFEHFAEEFPDRVNVKTFGNSPGLQNRRIGAEVEYDMVVAELTNGVDSIDEKEAVVFSLSIHGDERSGVEAGTRLLENVLRGEEPELEAQLDDIALVFVLANPDGWNARLPETVSAASSSSDTFTRVNGSNLDPNRQYPTAGLTDPNAYPGEPTGEDLENDNPNGPDSDVGAEYQEYVPDALWLVHELRKYESVAYAADFHGMYGEQYLVFGMYGNGEYSPRDQAGMDALNERLYDEFEAEIRPLMNEYSGAISDAASARGIYQTPSQPYGYGTTADTIDYNVTGSMGGWLGKSREMGGLGATSISFEMAIDNAQTARPCPYYGGLVTVQSAAYQACMRELASLAAEPVDGSIVTGGRSLAYVDSPSLTRSSDDASRHGLTSMEREQPTIDATDGSGSHELSVGWGAHTISVSVHELEGSVDQASLVAPNGETVRRGDIHGNGCCGRADWIVTDPDPGRWQLQVSGEGGVAGVRLSIVSAWGRPDPEQILNYQQREYEVTPISFLEHYGDAMSDGSATSLSVSDVANGALVSGGSPAYDQLVVIHDDGATSGAYVSALDEYVQAGGELVLTDSGVSLLASLNASGASAIGSSAINQTTAQFARLGSTANHPLVDDIRSFESELWTGPTIGYSLSNEAPLTVVDDSTFSSAGGDVAATASGGVIVGELGSITVIGSLLPPATQSNLHPFGLENYSMSPAGMRIFRAALGHDQLR